MHVYNFQLLLYIDTNENKKDRWDSVKSCLPTNYLMFHPDFMHCKLSPEYMCITYKCIATQGLCDLDFDLSKSLYIIVTYGQTLVGQVWWCSWTPHVSYLRLTVTFGLTLLPYKIVTFQICVTLALAFQGHSRSNLMVQLYSPYMISTWCLITTWLYLQNMLYSFLQHFQFWFFGVNFRSFLQHEGTLGKGLSDFFSELAKRVIQIWGHSLPMYVKCFN